MPRLIQDNFSKGMVTDVIGDPQALSFLYNAYVAKPNMISGRGPVQANYFTNIAPSGDYANGVSAAKFHPNIGLAYVQGIRDNVSTATSATPYASQDRGVEASTRFGLAISPLRSTFASSPQVAALETAALVTEGANKDQVYINAEASPDSTSFPLCWQACNTGSEIIFAGVEDHLFKWGGSTASPYSTGTVTSGGAASSILTGAGGADFSAVRAGQYILIKGIAEVAVGLVENTTAYLIKNVPTTTTLELEHPVDTGGAKSYRIQNVAVINSSAGTWNAADEKPRQTGVVAFHSSRLFTAGVADNETDYTDVFNLDRVRYSAMNTTSESVPGVRWGHDLWGVNDYFDVFPGKGGAIVGLVSMGRSLIVIKTHGLFRVTADFSYDNEAQSVPDIQVISDSIGAMSKTAWTVCDDILVFANERGAYVFDGDEVKSITDGRVSQMWNAELTAFDRMFVSNYEGKTFFHCSTQNVYADTVYNDAMVWDSVNDYWWIGSNVAGTCCETVYDAQDNLVGHFSFHQAAWAADTRSQGYHNVSNITHGWGFRQSGDWAEDADLASKRIIVKSTQFPLGADSVSEGRISEAYIHASCDAISGVDVEIHVGAGSTVFEDWSFDANYGPYTGQYFNADYTIPGNSAMHGTVSSDSYLSRDRVNRIDVSGEVEQGARGSVQLRLDPGTAVNYSYAILFNVFAIAIEAHPTEVRDYMEIENTGDTT